MRHSIGVISVFLLLSSAVCIASADRSKAVQTMAGILTSLNHFPTDAEKQSLKQIAEDKAVTEDERTIARALMNVQHTVAESDKAKLETIVSNKKAAASAKTLASAILNLNHKVSEADKKKLQALSS
jgi:hypothetical protein